MTYRFGPGFGTQQLGLAVCDPRVYCDGCGADEPYVPIGSRTDIPPEGWRLIRNPDGSRRDFCPQCKASIPGDVACLIQRIRNEERERCAKVCETMAKELYERAYELAFDTETYDALIEAAEKIRKGET
jgi:hypothetical protein